MNTIIVKTEADIDRVAEYIMQGRGVGFQIDASVEREENFRLMKLMNDRYIEIAANSNRYTADKTSNVA